MKVLVQLREIVGGTKRCWILVCMMVGLVSVQGQNIVATSAQNANVGDFVDSVLIGNGVTISNVKFNGQGGAIASNQIGTFYSNGFGGLGMAKGLLLTTGSVAVAPGPNSIEECFSPATSIYYDTVMSAYTCNTIGGCATLDFDFVCDANHVKFNYVFASEEYPEYVCSEFNDLFAFLITGPNATTSVEETRNMAVIPGSATPSDPDGTIVAINTINSGESGANASTDTCELGYSMYYVANDQYAEGIQYDGYTTKLTAEADIIPNTVYHMHISICNISDDKYDSGVFLEGNSFSRPEYGLTIEGQAVESETDTIVLCISDTVHMEAMGDGESTVASWVIDNTMVDDSTFTVAVKFDEAGDHTVKVLMHNTTADTSWTDTLLSIVHITPERVYVDTVMACSEYTWNGITCSESGTYTLKHTMEGCDSIETMQLYINPTYNDTIEAILCEGKTMTIGTNQYSTAGTYTEHLLSIDQCDSTVTMVLTMVEQPYVSIITDTLCRTEQYELRAETDAEYIRWTAIPNDASLQGQENEYTVRVAPSTTTTYIAYVDHGAIAMCPQSDSIHIARLHNIKAKIKAIPSLLHIDDLNYTAYDITLGNVKSRTWYIDEQRQLEQGKSMARTANPEADSLVLMLAVDNGQCVDTAHMTIPIYNVGLTAPNVFTPQRETNNRFMFGLKGVIEATVNIYDRSGRLVYSSPDASFGWDGTDLNGQECHQGDYVWKVEYRTEDYPNRKQVKVGTVALIK